MSGFKIEIRDFMGCERADIEAVPLALVTGKNAQGKSSICTAVALALSGQALPAGSTKGNAGIFVRTGAAKASVTLTGSDGHTAIAYPKAAISSEGTPPRASAWATGLASIVNLPDKERVETLRDIIGAQPTLNDFQQAAIDDGMDEKTIAAVWQVIERDGWDSAHKRAGDKGREIKAQWNYATGDNYGEKKAESWMPHGWSAGLESASKEGLDAVLVGARAELEAAIASAAVSAEKRAELEALAGQIEPRREVVIAANKNLLHAKEKHKAMLDKLATLPTGQADDAPATQPCPHCAGALVVRGGKVALPTVGAQSPEELQRQELAWRSQKQQADDYAKIGSDAVMAHAEAVAALKLSDEAARTLQGLPPETNAGADVDAMRTALRTAEADLKAWQQKHEADRLHRSVLANQRIINLLAPDGVRKRVLQRALGAFNEQLATIAAACNWNPTAITHDLTVEYGGRPYAPNCSESEQFRARVTLQLAMARLENSPVVIDGADVLDAAGRGGLFTGLRSLGMAAVIGMMANKADAVPNLKAMGLGNTYWINNGIAEAV